MSETYSRKDSEDPKEFARLFRLRAEVSKLLEDKSYELQSLWRGAAIDWWEEHSPLYDMVEDTLDAMVRYHIQDPARRAERRLAVTTIAMRPDEGIQAFNLRFKVLLKDTPVLAEDQITIYICCLTLNLREKVLCAGAKMLADSMAPTAPTASAQLTGTPSLTTHLAPWAP